MVIDALLDAESGAFCFVDEINNVRKDRTKLEMSNDTGFRLRRRRRRRVRRCRWTGGTPVLVEDGRVPIRSSAQKYSLEIEAPLEVENWEQVQW